MRRPPVISPALLAAVEQSMQTGVSVAQPPLASQHVPETYGQAHTQEIGTDIVVDSLGANIPTTEEYITMAGEMSRFLTWPEAPTWYDYFDSSMADMAWMQGPHTNED